MSRKGNAPAPQYPPPMPPHRGGDTLGLATLAGVVAVLVISFSNWREIDRIHESLDKLETQIAEAPRQAAPRQAAGELDPNRVYTIKTTDAPIKGPRNALVTVAEFSDFQ